MYDTLTFRTDKYKLFIAVKNLLALLPADATIYIPPVKRVKFCMKCNFLLHESQTLSFISK